MKTMKTKKCIYILFVILVGMMCVSCGWFSKSDDPLTAMNALAMDAELHADEWSESEMKEKFTRSMEIWKTFNDRKKDFDKDDFRTIRKDHKIFVEAISKTSVGKDLIKEGYFKKEFLEGEEYLKELIDYYGKVSD